MHFLEYVSHSTEKMAVRGQAFALLVCLLYVTVSTCEPLQFEHAYEQANVDLQKKDWAHCKKGFQDLISSMQDYSTKASACSIQCYGLDKSPYLSTIHLVSRPETVMNIALCLRKCFLKSGLNSHPPRQLLQQYKSRVLFDQVQICAYRSGDLELAAGAAFTYFSGSVHEEEAASSVEHYKSLSTVQNSWLHSSLEQPHELLYAAGAEAYKREDWPAVISHMEEALTSYRKSLLNARAWCLVSADDSDLSFDFSQRAIEIQLSMARCLLRALKQLDFIVDRSIEDSFPLMFHYLQYAYGKMNRLADAARAVANYLVLVPNDSVMIGNRKFYLETSPELSANSFMPEQYIVSYVEMKEAASGLLLQFSQAEIAHQLDNSGQDSFSEVDDIDVKELQKSVNKEAIEEFKRAGMDVFMTEVELEGFQRFAVDGVLNSEECAALVKLANDGATVGDGYMSQEGKTSPHTSRETFAGLTLDKAALKAQAGHVSAEAARLYLLVSERARDVVARYFELDVPLYFDYTHLVCRTALEDMQKERKDLSHPIHSDNCQIQSDFSCLKDPEIAYVQRDYSALLYLGTEFEGGKFIFAHRNMTDHKLIDPSPCGRMVAFNASTYHGVKAVTKGQRCAVAMWYTLDPRFDERSHQSSRHTLRQMGIKVPDQDYWAHTRDLGSSFRDIKQQKRVHSVDEL